MKRSLLTLSLACMAVMGQAQVIWSEDFEGTSGTAIPGTFTQTTLATDGGYKSGTSVSLSSTSFAPAEHSRFVCTNDDGCGQTCNKSADILMTPSFSLAGYNSNVYLQFDAFYYNGTYNNITESAEVQYSLNGGSSWTTLTTIPGNNGWKTHAFLLTPAFNQPNVKIAIKYNDGGDWLFGIAVDNMKVLIPPTKDVSTLNAYPNARYIHTNNAFSCRIQSLGMDPVTSVSMSYQLGTAAPVSQTFTLSPPLTFTKDSVLNFTPGTLTPGQNAFFKAWVTNINSTGPDAVNNNDTAIYNSKVYVATQGTTRNILIEEFTSSTCGPCASLNVTFDPLLSANNPNTMGQVNVIKYQMNWPSPGNDPSYNPDGLARRNFYGVSGIPDVFLDGRNVNAPNQAGIDAAKNNQAFSTMTAAITRNGTTYNGTVNYTPYVSVTGGSDLYLYQVYAQEYYNFPGATTSQKDYHHAQRKMMPNGNGGHVAATTSGTAISANSSYTFNTVPTPTQNSYDLWQTGAGIVEYVAFLQDTVTGQILQSASANISVGIVDLADNQSIGLYPVPANNFAVIATQLNNATSADLYVVDMTGKTVYRKEGCSLLAGHQEISINTSNFAEGTYAVLVKTPLGDLKEKLVVKH